MEPTEIEWSPFQQLRLATLRDVLTGGFEDTETTTAVQQIIGDADARERTPLRDLQTVLDRIRQLPPGIERVRKMNAFVRTLGQRDTLAMFLDILRSSLTKADEYESALSERSRKGRMHCIYGWAGQTLMLASHPSATDGTERPVDDLDFLGYPPAEWDMSIHIWQPNPGAKGFTVAKRFEPDVIVEPPHSHPFSFVSYVSKGFMHQSIYEVEGLNSMPGTRATGRYDGVILQEVDGIWPPHDNYVSRRLRTLEDRVVLTEGDSYFLPPHAIHDVEIDRRTAESTPAITLFLCAEAIVKPKAYLGDEMAQFHRENPDLKEVAVALSPEQWAEKLRLVASYLRGESAELRLGDVVRCNTSYGFMNT